MSHLSFPGGWHKCAVAAGVTVPSADPTHATGVEMDCGPTGGEVVEWPVAGQLGKDVIRCPQDRLDAVRAAIDTGRALAVLKAGGMMFAK